MNGVESVERKAIAIVTAQSLIAQPGQNAIGSQQSRQQVTLREAPSGALLQNLGRQTGGHRGFVVPAVMYAVSNPLETDACGFGLVRPPLAKLASTLQNPWGSPVNDVG